MLAQARALTTDDAVRYVRADLDELDLPESGFDLVYSTLALHYAENLEPVLQAVLCRCLHGLRIQQTCLGRLLLSGGTEHAIIALLDLVYDASMRVIEAEISGQKFRAGGLDSGGAP